MKVQFLSDGPEYRSRGGGSAAKVRRDESLFWWTILITLLLALATFCWFFSILVFKYPEKPFNYRLLTRLEKLEEIKNFDALSVPHGVFHGARELLAKYYNYNPDQLRLANDVLKRAYITNYTEEAPVYVKGNYTVTASRPLTSGDLIDKGWVVRARSLDLEDVEVELLLPNAELKEAPYPVGEKLTLENKSSFGSVVHVERNMETDGLCASLVPIAYKAFSAGGQKAISLAPPKVLNMESHWPLTAATTEDVVKVAAKVE